MPVVGLSGVPTTVSDLIEDTKRLLYSSTRMELNRLLSAMLSTDTTAALEFDLRSAVQGALISIEDEICYVFSATPQTKTVTIQRGYLGTIAATHAQGVLVEVNPRFPRQFIKEALQNEILSLPPRLFRVTAYNIPVGSGSRVYDLPIAPDWLHIIEVRTTPYLGRTTRPTINSWSVQRDVDPSLYPSGFSFQLLGKYPPTATLRISVARPFDVSNWTDTTDAIANIGLEDYMLTIPSYGAAWRLMSTKEVLRTDLTAQPEPRLAAEVQAGLTTQVANQLKNLRDNAIAEAVYRLREKYSIKGVA